MRRWIWLFGLVGAMLGCAPSMAQYQGVTASHIGCPPEEIKISNPGQRYWTADCRGKRYYCSVVGGHQVTVTCTAEGETAAPAATVK